MVLKRIRNSTLVFAPLQNHLGNPGDVILPLQEKYLSLAASAAGFLALEGNVLKTK